MNFVYQKPHQSSKSQFGMNYFLEIFFLRSDPNVGNFVVRRTTICLVSNTLSNQIIISFSFLFVCGISIGLSFFVSWRHTYGSNAFSYGSCPGTLVDRPELIIVPLASIN